MINKIVRIYLTAGLLMATSGVALALSPKEQLGKSIFFDKNLSINGNQSCASCHGPEVGWTGPNLMLNINGTVYEGSIAGRFGNRKPPSSAYATYSPKFHYENQREERVFLGGNFWDGRATGEKLGSPAADQAQGPFLNPLEQALNAPADVVAKICGGDYKSLFQQVWGYDACNMDKVDIAYDNVARSIAAFEASSESNAFTSKYDDYLKGKAKLNKQEQEGMELFKGAGNCASCHSLATGSYGQPPLFTDFSYDNLGVPRNPKNPFYNQTSFNPAGYGWIDQGLGAFLAKRSDYQLFAQANDGKQKVPTLRNVDKRPNETFVKAYTHNGYFKSLKSVVHFYNTRDVKPACVNPLTTEADALAQNCWPAPEIAANINTKLVGNLHLTGQQEDAIVAFMKTLSDGYQQHHHTKRKN